MQHVIDDIERKLRGIDTDIEYFQTLRSQKGRHSVMDVDAELSLLRSRRAQFERALEVLRGAVN